VTLVVSDLDGMERRILARLDLFEQRITEQLHTNFLLLVGLVVPLYVLLLGCLLAIAVGGSTILSRLP
jgi:hypothetical protein